MPAKVRVSGINVDIKVIPGSLLNSNTMGCNHTWSSTIALDADISQEQKKATLVHELTHAISDIHDSGMDERTVSTFSAGLFAVIRDNHDLFRWLQEE